MNDPTDYDYPFIDYFDPSMGAVTTDGTIIRPFGNFGAAESDIETALRLTNAAPKTSPLDVLNYFSHIQERGSTGEAFNERWRSFGNPVIVRFFHDIGYVNEKYPDSDCTPWCAAALSWAMLRTGFEIPLDPVSSQSFLSLGSSTKTPALGDIAVFTDIGLSTHGHVGLYISGDHLSVDILGGNQRGLAAGPTNCGPGFPKSEIAVKRLARNLNRDPNISTLYLRDLRSIGRKAVIRTSAISTPVVTDLAHHSRPN